MTTPISDSQAMRALAASRPDPEYLDEMWDEQRSTHVLNALTETPRPRSKSPRRWALIAAAAALVVGIGLLAQSIIPVGSPGAPVKATALEQLAQVAQTMTIPAGGYLQETVKDVLVDRGVAYTSTSTRWVANDGWVWEATVSSGLPHKTFAKAPTLAADASPATALLPKKLPSDPAVLKQQMLDRYAKLTKHPNPDPQQARGYRSASILAAVYSKLSDPRTSQADRVVLLRTLPIIDGLTINDNTVDPVNRPALAVSVTYHWDTDDIDLRGSIYFDPASGEPLGFEERTLQGALKKQQVITNRHIVAALPKRIIKVLGTRRVQRNVTVGFGG